MIANRIAKAVAIAAFLSGCGMSEYQDVSSHPEYRELVGQHLEATSDLRLHAVTLDRNYAKRVDKCVVTALPGFSGPELIFHRRITVGTQFQVLAVQKCTNCPFDNRVELVVSLGDQAACDQAPVTLNLDLLRSNAPSVRKSTGATPNNSSKPTPLRGAA